MLNIALLLSRGLLVCLVAALLLVIPEEDLLLLFLPLLVPV
jgi:hypothetical protein